MAVSVRSEEKKEVVEDDSHSNKHNIPSPEERPSSKCKKYGKFLKDLLSNKKKLEEVSKVSLSEHCSVVVQNKLPEKLGDSGRFTIPCHLGILPLHHALADLGASINLMPYSLYKQLDLGKLQPRHMSIALVDRSVKYPREIVENILVKVGKFVFPVDFVILDMEVDEGSVEDVGKHSHFVCMLDSFMDYHKDSDLYELEVGETAPKLEEPSVWAVELEKLLEEPDEYGDEVPDDLLEMMAEFDEIIGKPPSVGMTEEIVEEPDNPGESLEVVTIVKPIPEPLSCTVVHSERASVDPTPSSSTPRSRPPRKRTRASTDSSRLRIMQTPSVGMFKSDNLLGYMFHIIFGPGRYKLWWKDLNATCKMSSLFGSRMVVVMYRTGRPRRMKAIPFRIKEKPPDRLGVALDLAREIVGNEVPGMFYIGFGHWNKSLAIREGCGGFLRDTQRPYNMAGYFSSSSRYARSSPPSFAVFFVLSVLNLHSGGTNASITL
ncbi:hypothetical protein L1987_63444 [Smallanthus sonchifolius]|uniref:Uncharacterized protein n=1 Tax=Smallanthus sonchifolius TaxID=185202 RepID=A0ACB9CDJ1_9ASTR|nr:hypothetical protein L1987_63444 [Smallanthus sonchifolius]